MEPTAPSPADSQSAPRPGLRHHALAISLAAAGGALGIIGAGIEELRTGGGLLVLFVAAPIIEEALKPSGIYIGLIRWPHILRGQLYTAALAGLAGLVFGALESTLYVTLYVSNPPGWFVIYRFTVNLAVHVASSFVVGLGINIGVIDWARGRGPFPRASRNFFIAGVALHAVYNTIAAVLSIAGVFDVG